MNGLKYLYVIFFYCFLWTNVQLFHNHIILCCTYVLMSIVADVLNDCKWYFVSREINISNCVSQIGHCSEKMCTCVRVPASTHQVIFCAQCHFIHIHRRCGGFPWNVCSPGSTTATHYANILFLESIWAAQSEWWVEKKEEVRISGTESLQVPDNKTQQWNVWLCFIDLFLKDLAFLPERLEKGSSGSGEQFYLV